MNIEYLRELICIARMGNFSRAAEELYISQSSLSKHIDSLEKELGVKLFDRTTRNVVINEYGKLLLPYAEEIAAKESAFRESLRKKLQPDKDTLFIASIPVMSYYGIMDTIISFRREHPEIRFVVTEHEAIDIGRLLAMGRFELAFQRLITKDISNYKYFTYCSDSIVAVLPKNHPFASRKSISLSQLRNETFHLLDENTMLYSYFIDCCKSAGFEPNVDYKGRRFENIIELVTEGIGVSLLMRKQAIFYGNPDIACINIVPEIKSHVCLTRLSDRAFTPAAKLFWDFFLERAPCADGNLKMGNIT